jgi:two-component system response regulator DevR
VKPTRPPIRLLIVDDSQFVRQGIKTVLAAHAADLSVEVVGEAGTAAAACTLARELKPDIVLLDIRLPDGSGLEACREILRDRPETYVLILTSFSNDSYVYDAVIAGARGYLMKEVDPVGFMQALRDVAEGRSILDPEATARVLRLLREGGMSEPATDLSLLSAQERRVLALVAEGLTNKQVGEQLNLSENTVKNYLVSVFEKLQVKRRAQAAAIFVQQSRPAAQ